MGLIGRAEEIRNKGRTVCKSFFDRVKDSLKEVSGIFRAGKAAVLASGLKNNISMVFPFGFDIDTLNLFYIPENVLRDLTRAGFFLFRGTGSGQDFSHLFSAQEWENITEFIIYPGPDKKDSFYLLLAGSKLTPGREKLVLPPPEGIIGKTLDELQTCIQFIKLCASRNPERKTKQAVIDHIKSAVESGKTGIAFKITADLNSLIQKEEFFLIEVIYSVMADKIGASNILINRTNAVESKGLMEFTGIIFSSSGINLDSYSYFLLKPLEDWLSKERVSRIKITEDVKITSTGQIPAFTDKLFGGL